LKYVAIALEALQAMASSSSTTDAPGILVATMIVGAKKGGIAFLMGKRQIGPEKGKSWKFQPV
jgi:hypothetical protein